MLKLESFIPNDAETNLVFFVNGKKVIEKHPDPQWTLLWYLRKRLELTGTKYGCGEGGCGACTVMLSQYIRKEDKIKHIAVNACLTPLCSIHGLAVTTVEGIGTAHDRLHPVQERLAKSHGSQCGFCTPGIVMSMYTLLRNKTNISYEDIESALQGNLCRCTGYRPIIEGFKTFTEEWERQYTNTESPNVCMMGENCCKNKKDDSTIINHNTEKLFDKSSFKPYDSSQEPIFPPELKLNSSYENSYVYYKGENTTWIRPKTLEQILVIKNHFPESKIITGNTEIGVETKFKNKVFPIFISMALIPETNTCYFTNNGLVVGASTTLTDLCYVLKEKIQENPSKSKVFKAIADMLQWFAGNQVRSVASLTGNIMTASPISDLNPILMASSSVLNTKSYNSGLKKLIIDEHFFTGYRQTAVGGNEIVVSIEIPFSNNFQHIRAYKQARRKDDDISIVTAAFNIEFEEGTKKIKLAKLCFGGMAPTTTCAIKASKMLQGRIWDQEALNIVLKCLNEEFQLSVSTPGGMADYRKALSLSHFFRFYYDILNKVIINGSKVPRSQWSCIEEIHPLVPTSSQYFEIKNKDINSLDSLGKPIPHASAIKQVTGEAIYCDDIPQMNGELFLCLVFSTEAYAKIISIDASKALEDPEVVAFLSASDLEDDKNKFGPIIKDEEIFSKGMITSRACVIGAVVAKSELAARKAKGLVSVKYEQLKPVLVTLEDAIINESYFSGYPRVLRKGNVEESFELSDNVVEGFIRSGAQEHFYLETMSAYAIRKEEEIEITCTTQNPAEIASIVSQTLGIPNNRVIAKVKRVGGGFGGKETRAAILAIPVAIAAYKLKKPVRAVLERDEDMQVTGYRHPCLIKYKVGFSNDGKISVATFEIYCNAGNTLDISCSMIERQLVHVDNCYFIPNLEVKGFLCKTNMPSNTAFRGFGAPKAMFAAENMMRNIANKLSKTYEEVVEINLYKEGDLTHYNQVLTYCTLSRCWHECLENSNYWQRKVNVDEFNKVSRWKKKGISIVPTKYGISFQVDILHQAGALLLVYNDGSVLLSIGGIEMGQGLFTKMVQVASKALGISVANIHISEMSTDKVPNSSPTAASFSSDLYGMAVLNACEVLNKRIETYKLKNPKGKWEDWISDAYVDRVPLSATGFYSAPKIEYDREKNCGNLYEYFTYGVACSEVIIDCLTGDHQVLRTDIVMDVGDSLNPAIDIGQIEGAFMQGYGYYTLEEMVFSPIGVLYSRGPGTYKIPGFSDIPKVFNVSLLKGAPNPRAVYSSKAVGEPPLFLASSVFFAIKEAIKSARLDAGVNADFDLDAPATCARIRMACVDPITDMVNTSMKNDKGVPWNVVA